MAMNPALIEGARKAREKFLGNAEKNKYMHNPQTVAPVQQITTNQPRMGPGVVAPANSNDFTTPKVNISQPTTAPAAQGGFNYGMNDPAKSKALTQNIATWQNDAAAKNAEIQRALSVRNDLRSKGLDTSAQDKHLTGTLQYQDPVDAAALVATEEPVTPAPTDYSWITDMVNNELATQQATITQELARMQQANDLAVTQNNTWLQDNIKKLEENRIQAGAEITNFQNRRGGFYSGGVDYQTGHNNEVFAEAQGEVTKDIGARNADIWNRNALLAQQAATNLATLQQQAPARIQQLIAEQMEKDRAAAISEAGITGIYKGAPTMAMSKITFDQNLATDKQALDTRIQDTKETDLLAKLTGYLPDGTPTTTQQQTILKNAWTAAEKVGYVTAELSRMTGIPKGTKTLDAIKVVIQQQNANISQQNANTSSANSSNSASNTTLDNLMASFKAKGFAPAGLESLGIYQGDKWSVDASKTGTPKVDPKISSDRYNDILDDIDAGATEAEAKDLLAQNSGELTDADYRKANEYINKQY